MKLKIENWVENNKFSENVIYLYSDSIICYKAGAYRASLLFSYLAFLTILKERIIGAQKPALYEQGNWNDFIQKINNEDSWEQAVFDATQQREKRNVSTNVLEREAVFPISDNLRNQILYWKNRRNDCAHFKDNKIEGYHVESFWAFVESNLSKITVEGGFQALLIKLNNHFNPTLNPPDKDYDYLVKEIENSTESFKMREFWDSYLKQGEYDFELTTARKKIMNRSFALNSAKTNESLIKILKEDKYYKRDFLGTYPDKILYLNLSAEEVRKFWQLEIHDYSNSLSLYSVMLRNLLIPVAEIEEANKVIVTNLRKYEVEPHEHQVLVIHKFYNALKSEIFENVKFNEYLWVNGRADIIASILVRYEADLDVLNKLCFIYGQSTNSNWLLERLDKIFVENAPITKIYKDLVIANNVLVPPKLEKYFI